MLRLATDGHDPDPIETSEWVESLASVVEEGGPTRAEFILKQLREWSDRRRLDFPLAANTPYCNTISHREEAPYPGDREIERRIKSMIRWNALAMVVRANRGYDGIGGHIATYASMATLYEVGFNHFFRGHSGDVPGDHIYFQGHAAPGVYARAFLEGRIPAERLRNFRHELAPGGGLSSYPHPWLMPDFWEFPTVSMGLGPISSIYQARFNRYLHNRGLADTSQQRVWAFIGDGECDEPETLGSITLASREQLDNLTWVINCNLQRLDGPVRGNGSIIQELEAAFRGAGWNVIKVIWGSDWDPLFDADEEGHLVTVAGQVVDGQYQRYIVEDGAYIRQNFFGRHPKLLELVKNYSDDQIKRLRLGGHDPLKVYNAYKAAVEHRGQPTVILARTIKGYGTGDVAEGRNTAHQQKKLDEEDLRAFRDRFNIPISDEQVNEAAFWTLDRNSPEFNYLMERRRLLNGHVPGRRVRGKPLKAPPPSVFDEFYKGTPGGKASTTMAFARMLRALLRDKELGKLVVPIVADEARTFGMDALFPNYGIYAHAGQLYEPVDHKLLLRYEEKKTGQILQEGITEAGALCSFTAAGTAYATHGINTIPFFTFYSMFGYQRVGDLIWAAADARAKGFLMGATAGRTTLPGEGLQHLDGQSQLFFSVVPNCHSYDPAFAYELATIIQDGVRRMYEQYESCFYYITIYNEQYEQPAMPDGVREGILKGMYKVRAAEKPGKLPRIHLFGSGPILREALRAQQLLRERFEVAADVWSVTSYTELHRDALAVERSNRLHPEKPAAKPYIVQQLEREPWPVVAASDWVKLLAQSVAPWCPKGLTALGTDGFGRSDTREALRRFFGVDAENIALAALTELTKLGQFDVKKLPDAIRSLGLDPDAPNPAIS